MFTFTWIDSNYIKNNLTVKGAMNALTMYNILHNNVKAHNLKCLMKTEDIETYIVFVNDRAIAV